MSTLSSLRTKTRNELKIDLNGRIWGDSVVNSAIIQAVKQIQQDGNFDWHFNDAENSQATVISTGTYTLPTGFVRLENDTVKWDGHSLLPADFNWLKRTYSTLALDGQVSYYYLRRNEIGLYPRPNDTKTLEFSFRKKLTDMSGGSDDSGMESDFDEAIIQYASYLLWKQIQGREDKAIQAIQNYKQAMEGLYAQYLGRRDDVNYGFSFETIADHAHL